MFIELYYKKLLAELFLYCQYAETKQDNYAAEKQAVKPVENSAVAGQELARVLYAALALYRAFE